MISNGRLWKHSLFVFARDNNILLYETNNKGEANMTKKWYNKPLPWIAITITITVGSIIWAFRSKKD